MPIAERRGRQRMDVRWPVRIHHTEVEYEDGETANISLVNLIFVSAAIYAIGDSVQVEILIRPDQWIHCIVSITRSEPASRRRYAYGAVIRSFSDDHRRLLQERLIELEEMALAASSDKAA